MAMSDDIRAEIRAIWNTSWETRNGTKVPESEDIKLGKDAVLIDGAVLYADLAESTAMVNKFKNWFAANVYKSYLLMACKVIRSNSGVITAFDGDRVMAVYIGGGKESAAAKTGLQINWAVEKIINPEIAAKGYDTPYAIKQVVGVDVSQLFVAKTGIRGANDLVWVGRAANYAAKLSGESGVATWITADIYNALDNSVKFGQGGQNMWTARTANSIGATAYASSWIWSI